MSDKIFVITFARGFGSGGKEIATKVADRLNIPCYENQILDMASEYSGVNQSLFYAVDEKLRKKNIAKYIHKIPRSLVVNPSDKLFISDVNLFNIQAEIIKSLSETESCVIVGKCADYILRDCDNVASIYIEAPRAACVDSIVKKMHVSEEKANSLIETTDKYRADYYKFYSKGGYWTNPINYDMTLNSARVGRDKCVDVIVNYVTNKFNL